jgi:hypothetical protein
MNWTMFEFSPFNIVVCFIIGALVDTALVDLSNIITGLFNTFWAPPLDVYVDFEESWAVSTHSCHHFSGSQRTTDLLN